MAGNPPAFQLYADDFLGGTCDMTQAEVGAYFLLLLYQWNNESIPADAKRQRLIAKGSVSSRVIEKFPASEDGLLRNERMEIERQKQIEYRNGQSDSGKRGAAKRWGRHSDPNVVAIVSPITPPSNRQWRKDSSPVSSLQSPNNIPPSPREEVPRSETGNPVTAKPSYVPTWFTVELKLAWQQWMEHLAERSVRPTRMTVLTWQQEMQRYGIPHAIETIRFSISKGAKSLCWDGPFNQKQTTREKEHERTGIKSTAGNAIRTL